MPTTYFIAMILMITSFKLFTLLVLLTYFIGNTNGIVSTLEDYKSKSFWDFNDFERRIHSSGCDCGKFDSVNWSPSWNLYVHSPTKTCTGTVINSNLIVTSHQCLLLEGGTTTDNISPRMRLVDLLKFELGLHSIASAEQITVTNIKDKNSSDAKKYRVIEVWYNPYFAVSSETMSSSIENDLVLIKVSADLISTGNFTPICIPLYNEKLKKVDDLLQSGFYYDNTGGIESNTPVVPVRIEGQIMKKSDCYAALGKKIPGNDTNALNKTLCLQYADDGKERNAGGPVIVTDQSSKNVAFLLGVATEFDKFHPLARQASEGLKFTYFSYIHHLVKFIEYYSQLGTDASTWCRSNTKLTLQMNKMGLRTHISWPWDRMNFSTSNRDESLDCVCGEPNTKIMGRVVGGVEATPREFGWMTLLGLYAEGRSAGASLCGGSIINDRLVLTAAHCVVVNSWLMSGRKQVSIHPKNIDVTFNAHLRKGDPEAIRLKGVSSVVFHPQYLPARLAEPDYYDADIALLVLEDPIQFPAKGPGLRPICLPKIGENIEVVGKSAWVVGWGLTNPKDRSSSSDTLQKIQLPIENLKFCSDVTITHVPDTFICAGTLNMYKDAASGDSGGPLQMEDRTTSQWYQVGAVSWGEDVIQDGKTVTAALYADVQKLMPFIDYHSQRLGAKWCKSKRDDDTTAAT